MEKNKKIFVLLKIYKGDVSPFDECAIECALSFPNSEVTLISMAPLSQIETLENFTRLGANAILISDSLYAGSDTIITSKILGRFLEIEKPDLIFCGRESLDGNTGQVPLMLSELLHFELANKVMSINDQTVSLRDGRSIKLDSHQLVTFEKFKLLSSPSINSKKREVRIVTNKDLGFSKDEVGLIASPTRVIDTYTNENDRRICEFIEYRDLETTIASSLKKNPTEKKNEINKAPLIHFVGKLYDIAALFGEKCEEIQVDGFSIDEIIQKINAIKPRIILWEENEIYKPLASQVAIKMNLGLCADCISFDYQNDRFVMVRPALGGNVIASIVSNSSIAMATIKATSKIKEDVAITIGRGAMKHFKKIESLADKYHAKIYSTRPLADSGFLPYETQVGLTGITITPKVCITLGTSGAIQHVVGINKSTTIIAININKKEPIFCFSDYGIIMDIKDM